MIQKQLIVSNETKSMIGWGIPELIISAVANMPLLFINPLTMPTRRQSSNSSETANSITQHCTGFHDSTPGFFFFPFNVKWNDTVSPKKPRQ